ncbi:hypothetical protein ACLBR5_13665 [Escherichia coli]
MTKPWLMLAKTGKEAAEAIHHSSRELAHVNEIFFDYFLRRSFCNPVPPLFFAGTQLDLT